MECPECGFDYTATGVSAARALVAGGTSRIGGMVASAERADRRPAEGVWSALEYACHVRDVLLAQRERMLLTLVEDDPSFVPIYRDERVEHARYASEDPVRVAAQVSTAAELFTWVVDGLDEEALARPCIYNFPEPARRDIGWLIVHTAHEVVHHTMDIRTVVGAERE